MTDARRRARERAAEDEQGDVAARARALTERVRAGDLTPERLRLAAHLGDPPARVALGADAPKPLSIEPPRGLDPPPDSEHAPAWLAMRIVDRWLAEWASLARDGGRDGEPVVALAAAIAVARFALEQVALPPALASTLAPASTIGPPSTLGPAAPPPSLDALARMYEALEAAEALLDAPAGLDQGAAARDRCAAAVERAWPGIEQPEALPERLVYLAATAPLTGAGRRGLVGRWLDEAILAWGTLAVRDAIVAGLLPWSLR